MVGSSEVIFGLLLVQHAGLSLLVGVDVMDFCKSHPAQVDPT